MKIAIILISLFVSNLMAQTYNPVRLIGNYFKQKKYAIHSNSNHFESCQKFNQNSDEENYYVSCNEERELIQNQAIDELYTDAYAIEKEVLKEDFLSRLKNNVIQKINTKIEEVNHLQGCLEQNTCPELRQGIINGLKNNLPKMRILMAQRKMPGKIYSPTRPIRYQREINHDIGNKNIPPLTEKEAEFIHQYTWDLEDDFTELVKIGKPEFANSPAIVDTYVSKKFEEQNEKYNQEYERLVSQNPLLSLVSATGDEDDEFLINQALKAFGHIQNSLLDLREEKIHENDLSKLIIFQDSTNNLLSEMDSKIYCDIASDVLSEHEMDELKEDLFLAGAMLVGGGACAYTFGIGCMVGVAVIGEGYAIHSALERQGIENDLFMIGESSIESMQSRNFERDLTMYLAPLSILGEGAGLLVKRSFKTLGRLLDNTAEFKRIDFNQRQALDELEQSLGFKKQRFNNYYNPGNELNLSSGDQIYFAGIIEELNKKGLKDTEIKEYIDDLMKECNGGSQ